MQHESKKLVLLIPVYNDPTGLEITLKSIVMHGGSTPVIVSDNCSDLDLHSVIRKYDGVIDIVYIRTGSNLGRVGNWNYVLREAEKRNYRWVKFLFSGEELLDNFKKEVSDLLAEAAGASCIVHDYEFNQNDNISISRSGYNGFLSKEHVVKACLIDGGFMGSIVSNFYNTNYTTGKSFALEFHGKNDFDFMVALGNSAFASTRILTRSNIAMRQNFYKSQDYWLTVEYVYNWSYWLEKRKDLLSPKDYQSARNNITRTAIIELGKYCSPTQWVSFILRATLTNITTYSRKLMKGLLR